MRGRKKVKRDKVGEGFPLPRKFALTIEREAKRFPYKKPPTWGVYHKVGFTCCSLVGRWLAAAVTNSSNPMKQQEMNHRHTTKDVRSFVRSPFPSSCLANTAFVDTIKKPRARRGKDLFCEQCLNFFSLITCILINC